MKDVGLGERVQWLEHQNRRLKMGMLVVLGVIAALATAAHGAPLPPAPQRGNGDLRILSTTNEVTCLAIDRDFVWVGSRGGLRILDRAAGVWHRMTSADGLPGNGVTSICRAASNVWLTTKTGLARWKVADPRDFTRWEGSLNADLTLVDAGPVLVDAGTVYVGEKSHWSAIRGAATLVGGRWRNLLSATEGDEGEYPGMQLLAVGNGACWFSLLDGDSTAVRYHMATGTWRTFGVSDGLPSEAAICAAATPTGVWLLTRTSGLAFFDGRKWTRHQPALLSGKPASSLAVAGGTLWVGTEAGVLQGSGRPLRWSLVDGGPRSVTALGTDDGELWCGTARDGVWHRTRQGEWEHHRELSGPPGNQIWDVAFVGTEVFMAGSSGISALDLSRGTWRYWTSENGLQTGQIQTLAVDDSELWYVAAIEQGDSDTRREYTLASLDTKSGRPSGTRLVGVSAVAAAKPGFLVMARGNLIQLYDVKEQESRTLGNLRLYDQDYPAECPFVSVDWPLVWYEVSKPQESDMGLRCSGFALMQYDDTSGNTTELISFKMGYGPISTARVGDSLWSSCFGSEREVVRYSLREGTSQTADALDAAWVTSLAWIDPYLWVGTAYYEGERCGLVRYRPDTRMNRALTVADGLPSPDIGGLAAHDGDLWVLTSCGVAVLSGKGSRW